MYNDFDQDFDNAVDCQVTAQYDEQMDLNFAYECYAAEASYKVENVLSFDAWREKDLAEISMGLSSDLPF